MKVTLTLALDLGADYKNCPVDHITEVIFDNTLGTLKNEALAKVVNYKFELSKAKTELEVASAKAAINHYEKWLKYFTKAELKITKLTD